MTFEQTRDILTILQAEYGQSFMKMSIRDKRAKLMLWAEEFRNDDYNVVYAAVRSIISSGNREFAPNIGHIRAAMRELFSAKELSTGEAWALVVKACSNGIYCADEEYEQLPKEVQMAVGSAEQIREWAQVDSDQFNTVIASNFRRSFETVSKRERNRQIAQEDVQRVISSVAERMVLPGVKSERD